MLFDVEYKIDPALSQSDLSKFETDLSAFKRHKIDGEPSPEIKSNPMDIGNIVDAIMLKPEELKKYYVVTDLKATGKIKDIIEEVVKAMRDRDRAEGFPDTIFPEWVIPKRPEPEKKERGKPAPPAPVIEYSDLEEKIFKAAVRMEYQPNWPKLSTVDKILEKGGGYYQQCIDAGDRIMIGLREWNKAHTKVDAARKDEYTSAFLDTLFVPREDIVIHRQTELYGEFEGRKIKGMIDLFLEDTARRVISPWDVKTAASHWQFLKNYRIKKYGRQGAMYAELLRQNYPSYKIDPFCFLVIPIETDERPECFEMDPGELYVNAYGYTFENGVRLKGWQELVREIVWHEHTGKWDHRREYYATGKNIISSRAIINNDLLEPQEKPDLI